MLVCVYYRVASTDQERAIAQVRDFQRTLAAGMPGLAGEVLVRCQSGCDPSSPPAATDAGRDRAAPDATLMETYRLPPLPDCACQSHEPLLRALQAGAAALAPLLRGPRHVEVFVPCAS